MESSDRPDTALDGPPPDALQEALSGLSEELLAPTAVLKSYAPRLAATVERGDSATLVVIADLIERNAANLEAVLKSWERLELHQPEQSDSSSYKASEEVWQIVLHELRNPITVIQGSASTLKTAIDFVGSSNLAKMSRAIERSAARLGELVESFGNFQALSRGEMELNRSKVDLGGLVGQIVRDLEALTHPHPVSVVVGDRINAIVDPLRLRQVITNLLSNAAKFSETEAPIRVEVTRSDGQAAIAVIDRGPGIRSDRMGELFKKFSRLDARVSGTGLGLYVSRAIARAHGGDLTLTSPPEGGSRFVLSVPAEP